MRVLVVSSVFPYEGRPSFGIFVRERMRHVASHCEVVVVSPRTWFPFNRWIRGRERCTAGFADVQAGMAVYRPRFLCIPRFGKVLDGLLYFLGVLPLVLRLRRTFRFDLIDAHFAYPDGLAAVLLGKVFRRPVVITMRGDEARLSRYWLRRVQMRFALKRAARVISVSDSLRDVAAGLGVDRERVRVIPNGVDTALFRPSDRRSARQHLGLPGDGPILLSVGDLSERKGHHRIVEILPDVVAWHPNLLYVAMGEDLPGESLAKLIERLASEHGVNRHVRMMLRQPHDEIPLWMAAADLFCLATRWEGWCNALMEARACGLPVVTTRVGGNAEFIIDGSDGFLVPYWDANAFRDAILKALEFPWDRQAIAARAAASSWERTATQVMEEFCRAVESREANDASLKQRPVEN